MKQLRHPPSVLPGPKPLPSFFHSIPLSFWLDTRLATAVPTPTHAQEAHIQHALRRTCTRAHTHTHTRPLECQAAVADTQQCIVTGIPERQPDSAPDPAPIWDWVGRRAGRRSEGRVMEAGDGPRLAADGAGRMEGTDALCPASLPLSLRSVPSWGDGETEDGGRVAFGSWQAGGAGSAQAGQCRHWLPPLHSAICLASLPTPSLSLSLSLSLLHPQQNEKRKTGSSPAHAQPLPDPSPAPATHHTTPPPSHLCSLLLAQSPSLLRLALTPKRVQCFLKNRYICILQSNLKGKPFSLGMSCPSESGSSVPMFMAGRGRGPCPQLVPMNPMPGRRGGWGGVGAGWGIGRALFSLRLWWFLFFFFFPLPLPEQLQIDLEPSPPPVPRAPVPFSPCF